MSNLPGHHPCPCPGCDRESLDPDEYCVTCMHFECRAWDPQCSEV